VNSTTYIYNILVADQSTAAKQAAADVLYSNNATNVAKSKAVPVALTFDHVLSKVTLNVTLGDGLTSLTGSDITAAKLTGMPQTATMALQDGTVTAGTTGDISSLKGAVPSGASYDATFSVILIPQSSGGTNRTIVFTVDGQDYTGTIPDGDAFAPGNHYTYPVTVKKSGVTMGTVSIGKWGENDNTTPTDPNTAVEFVKIPAGTFWMGSPANEPNRSSDEIQHKVTLTKDFYMSKYPVTNAQYAAFLNAKGIGGGGSDNNIESGQRLISTSSGSYDWGLHWEANKWVPVVGYENHPVIYVTWFGAKAYADWVGGRLPSEAMWEYACRGNYPNKATEQNTLPFGIGDGKRLDGTMANINGRYIYNYDAGGHTDLGSGNGIYLGKTSAVGSYSPNNYGLYDMHGNVWEWCGDWYGGYGTGLATNPEGPDSGNYRVLRGGGWNYDAQYCRSTYRYGSNPGNGDYDYGFRVAVVVP